MKHVIKVASLENLPSTKPLVAMDNEGNLGWVASEAPFTPLSTPPNDEIWYRTSDG